MEQIDIKQQIETMIADEHYRPLSLAQLCLLYTSYIGEGAKLDHVIVDKAAIVNHVKKLVGTDDSPIYVKRRDRI